MRCAMSATAAAGLATPLRRRYRVRSTWIRPSATTSQSCRAMRPLRSRAVPKVTAWVGSGAVHHYTSGDHVHLPHHGRQTAHATDAAHALPTLETLGLRVPGRLPAER